MSNENIAQVGDDTMRKILTVLVVAATIPGAAIATSSNAEAGAGVGVPERSLAESLPVLSSGAQSRHGRITTRMGTTDITDTDHIPITDHRPATTCGTVTPGYPLAN